MRFAVLIFVTILLSGGASCFIWRELLKVAWTTPQTSPAPSARERQYGMPLDPQVAAALERRLPEDFACDFFEPTLRRMVEGTGLAIEFGWRHLEPFGDVTRETPVDASVAGMRLGDAIPLVLAGMPSREPLGCEAEGRWLRIDVKSQVRLNTLTRVYDIRDLLPRNHPVAANAAASILISEIEASVAPATWRRAGGTHGSTRHLSGQLIVTQTQDLHFDVMRYLDGLRVTRARHRIVARAAVVTVAAVAIVAMVRLGLTASARRAARRAGLCRTCGYDLRASEGRCPECGTDFAPTVAS